MLKYCTYILFFWCAICNWPHINFSKKMNWNDFNFKKVPTVNSWLDFTLQLLASLWIENELRLGRQWIYTWIDFWEGWIFPALPTKFIDEVVGGICQFFRVFSHGCTWSNFHSFWPRPWPWPRTHLNWFLKPQAIMSFLVNYSFLPWPRRRVLGPHFKIYT